MNMTQQSIQHAQAVHLKASSAGLPIIQCLSAYLLKQWTQSSRITVTDLWHRITTTPGLGIYIGSQRNSFPINYRSPWINGWFPVGIYLIRHILIKSLPPHHTHTYREWGVSISHTHTEGGERGRKRERENMSWNSEIEWSALGLNPRTQDHHLKSQRALPFNQKMLKIIYLALYTILYSSFQERKWRRNDSVHVSLWSDGYTDTYRNTGIQMCISFWGQKQDRT